MRLPSLPILLTDRLALRALKASDKEDLFSIYGDAQTMQFASDPTFLSLETVDEMLRSVERHFLDGTSLEWGVEDKATQRLVGTCGLHSFESDPPSAEMGCMLKRSHWGQGLMFEAANAVITFGFRELALTAISADIDAPNVRSQALFKRLGFAITGEGRFMKIAAPDLFDS
jgi:[ribosomal protein S5]-alanine N-acetyltransferase